MSQVQADDEQEKEQDKEEEIIWGAMVDVEKLCQNTGDSTGLAVMRAQASRTQVDEEEKSPADSQIHNSKGNQPAFSYESRAANPEATQKMFQRILDVTVPNVTVNDLVALSGDLRKEIVDYTRTQRVPKPTQAQTTAALAYSTPLQEIDVRLAGKEEVGLLDEGSEIVVVRKDVWEELGFKVNPEVEMVMQTANGGKEPMLGCAENLEIEVGGLKTRAHAFVVPQAPFRLLLGRPWQMSVRLAKEEDHEGNVTVTVHDPRGIETPRRVQTRPRKGGSFNVMTVEEAKCLPEEPDLDPESSLANFLLRSTHHFDPINHVFAY